MHHPLEPHEISEEIERASQFLRNAERVVVLTGAGISAESGVPTFRGSGGLWHGHNIYDVATPEAFARDPKMVWEFYNFRREGLAQIKPNPGHYALVVLEQRFAKNCFTIVTQNIDGLHRAAGSRNIQELHGNLRRIKCSQCEFIEDRDLEPLPSLPKCPKCAALLRPDVVWFGETLPMAAWMASEQAASHCDCFLVVGTSAIVFPAAGLISHAKDHGAKIVEINMEQTQASSIADVGLYGPSGEILPKIVAHLS